MARRPRIHFPGVLYHAIIRGNRAGRSARKGPGALHGEEDIGI